MLPSHGVELPWTEEQEPSVLSLVQLAAHLCWLFSPLLLCRGECCVLQCWRPVRGCSKGSGGGGGLGKRHIDITHGARLLLALPLP